MSKKKILIPKIILSVVLDPPVSSMASLKKLDDTPEAFRLCQQCYDPANSTWREEMHVVILNRNNRVLGSQMVSMGGISGTVVDPKVIFGSVLSVMGSGFILTHNHPSGNLLPSREDKEITKRLQEGGKVLDLALIDHIIVSGDQYYSFRENGLL